MQHTRPLCNDPLEEIEKPVGTRPLQEDLTCLEGR